MDPHPEHQLSSQNSPNIPRLEDAARASASTTLCNSTEVMSIDDSLLVGAPVAVAVDADFPLKVQGNESVVLDVEVKVEEGVIGKRKRGRPPRAHSLSKPPPPQKKREEEEEDVCFICFDGGSLVLCDRRGCPKAYHPACVKRDESFFQSKAKWNCGWHICSSCERTSHFMCYTCTYSLCKGCTKGADYVCVRGNKGFCGICMRTIFLIENQAQYSQEMVRVDFDDKTSWEYLFKVYWICLKEKLSLTLEELTQAKNPWRGNDNVACKVENRGECKNGICEGAVGVNIWKRCRINDQAKLLNQVETMKKKKLRVHRDMPLPKGTRLNSESLCVDSVVNMKKPAADRGLPLPEGANWASNELLEFVAHMKKGETSTLSQFDVQALLLDYIRKNNLRDPDRKCEVICDSRLLNLFGKPRVGHFEMLKLLEYHFLLKENSKADEVTKNGTKEAFANKMDANISSNNNMMGDHKRRKKHKKAGDTGPQVNPNEYAAIDVHNISLIYLRRNLLESLLDHAESLHDKIVGSVVRIKISGTDQQEDLYRLVQVIGTSKVDEPYKFGMRTVDIMLEILNLDRRELVTFDEISNQDFSEDECRHLHQSVKRGLIKWFTMGQIRQKAITLQESRVNSGLEAELLRLSHLRDRANEKGLRKELIECVEKIELLSSSEERQRRLLEIPEVHVDQSMDRPHQPEKARDKKKKDKPMRQNIESSRKRRAPIAARRWNGVQNQVDPASSIIRDLSNQLALTSELSSATISQSFLQPYKESGQPVNSSKIDRIWHYQDPTGKVQGPFSMLQLQKWSSSGLFPPDLRVWRTDEKQHTSILLIDALNGRCDKDPMSMYNSQSLSQDGRITSHNGGNSQDVGPSNWSNAVQKDDKSVDGSQSSVQTGMSSEPNGHHELVNSNGGDLLDVKVTSYTRDNNWDGGCSSSMNVVQKENQSLEGSQRPIQNDIHSDNNGENNVLKSTGEGCQSSNWNSPSDVNSCMQQRASLLQGWDSPRGNDACSVQLQVCGLAHLPSISEKQAFFDQITEGKGGKKWILGQSDVNDNLYNTAESQTNSRNSSEKQTNSGNSSEKQSDSEGYSGQSSGRNWRPSYLVGPSEVWDSGSGIPSVPKSTGTLKENHESNISELPSDTMKPTNKHLNEFGIKIEQPVSGIPIHDCPSWSNNSTLVGDVSLSPEVAGEARDQCTPAEPSAEERGSCLVSGATGRPEKVPDNHAASSTSGNEASYPIPNPSTWQDIINESGEFCPLIEESISDLLAEVEAMESLKANGLGAPISTMNCGEDFTEGSRDGCFSTIGNCSPGPNPGKGDAFSYTGELQVASQSTVTDEPRAVLQSNVIVLQRRPGEHCSPSTEGVARYSDLIDGKLEKHYDINLLPPSTTVLGMCVADISERLNSEVSVNRFGPVQQIANLSFGGLAQRNRTLGREAGHATS